MVDRVDINRLLLEMRALKTQSSAFGAGYLAHEGASINGPSNEPKFTEVMAQAVNKVNEVQQASAAMSKAYIQGDPSIDVTDVMIASQKAGVAFDSMVQVRNKLVEAYRDVMNMPL